MTDERQPLLARASDVENTTETLPDGDDKQQLVWYTALVFSGFIALGFIIRGLIAAGSTDVSIYPC